MDQFVEDQDELFEEVFAHMKEVQSHSAATLLNADLLRRAGRSLDSHTSRDLLWRMLTTGEQLLQSLQQDPRPLTRLLEQIVRLIPFDELKSTISTEKLIQGLTSSSVPVSLLCLAYLHKAADSPSGASFVASDQGLVRCLVAEWLSSDHTEIGERSVEVIVALLAVDDPQSTTVVSSGSGPLGEAEGHGLMWRRMFRDIDIYTILFAWTSLIKSSHDLSSKKGQQAVTVSQARLFDFISRVALLDWSAITTSWHASVEREYSAADDVEQPYGGILKYAANGMIDHNDYLMEVLRRDFFVKLLQTLEEGSSGAVPPKQIAAIQQNAGVQKHNQDGTGLYL